MNNLDPMLVGRPATNLDNNLSPGKVNKSDFKQVNFDFIEEDPLEYEHKQQDQMDAKNNQQESYQAANDIQQQVKLNKRYNNNDNQNIQAKVSGNRNMMAQRPQFQQQLESNEYQMYQYNTNGEQNGYTMGLNGIGGGNMDEDSNSGATNKQMYYHNNNVPTQQTPNHPQPYIPSSHLINHSFNNDEQIQLLLIQREMIIERRNLYRAPHEIQEQITLLRTKMREIQAEIRGLQKALILQTHPAYINPHHQPGMMMNSNQQYGQINMNYGNHKAPMNTQQSIDVQRINSNLYNNYHKNDKQPQKQQMDQFNKGIFHYQDFMGQTTFQKQPHQFSYQQNFSHLTEQNMKVGMGRHRVTQMNPINLQLHNQPPYPDQQIQPMIGSYNNQNGSQQMRPQDVRSWDYCYNNNLNGQGGQMRNTNSNLIEQNPQHHKFSSKNKMPKQNSADFKSHSQTSENPAKQHIDSGFERQKSNFEESQLPNDVDFNLRNIPNTSDKKIEIEEGGNELIDDEGFVASVNSNDSVDVEDEGEINYTPE